MEGTDGQARPTGACAGAMRRQLRRADPVALRESVRTKPDSRRSGDDGKDRHQKPGQGRKDSRAFVQRGRGEMPSPAELKGAASREPTDRKGAKGRRSGDEGKDRRWDPGQGRTGSEGFVPWGRKELLPTGVLKDAVPKQSTDRTDAKGPRGTDQEQLQAGRYPTSA